MFDQAAKKQAQNLNPANQNSATGSSQPKSSGQGFDLQDNNQDKDFPFQKVNQQKQNTPKQANQRQLANNKGPVEDMFEGTKEDNPQAKDLPQKDNQADNKQKINLQETPNVPSMNGPAKNQSRNDSNNQIPAWQPAQEKESPTASFSMQSSGQVEEHTTIRKKGKNKLMTVVIVIFVIVLVALAGYFIFQYFNKQNQNQNNNTSEPQAGTGLNQLLNTLNEIQQENTPKDNQKQPTQSPENNNPSQKEPEQEKTPLEPPQDNQKNNPADEFLDSDQDGLTDLQEIELGTDKNKFDTDSDGLSDFEEIEIYKSDPLIADTDGDGYEDGKEVENGYHPLIPGNARLGD